jgi:hypothetical protein
LVGGGAAFFLPALTPAFISAGRIFHPSSFILHLFGMASSVQSRFAAAVLRGMAASPFATTISTPVYLIRGSTRTALSGCSISHTVSEAPLEETGIRPGHQLKVHILKSLVPTMPDHELDALEYQGRKYKFQPPGGREPFSPVWTIEAFSPLKS